MSSSLDSSTGLVSLAGRWRMTRARSLLPSMGCDLHIQLSAGRHFLSSPLQLQPKDSGANGFRVVWRSQQEERPTVLSGGLPLKSWQVHDPRKNAWRAKVPDGVSTVRHLWINGVRCPRTTVDTDAVLEGANIAV